MTRRFFLNATCGIQAYSAWARSPINHSGCWSCPVASLGGRGVGFAEPLVHWSVGTRFRSCQAARSAASRAKCLRSERDSGVMP